MKLSTFLALTCGTLAQRDTITDKCPAEFKEKATEGKCSRYVEYEIKNNKLDGDNKHTISFNYNVDVTSGIPTFHGHIDIKGCCKAESTVYNNLGGGKYRSGN